MPKAHRRPSAKFKFKVAVEAAKGHKIINKIASEAGLHQNLGYRTPFSVYWSRYPI